MGEAVYQPANRRPIAGIFRRTAQGVTALCVRWNVGPDAISYLSIVFSALAGLYFLLAMRAPPLLLIAPLFCYARLYCNMLDGMVALASGKASRRGEIINELPDRISDIIIFVAVAHSGLCHLLLGYWAMVLAVMTAYVGVLGQAAGAQREFGGVMAKPYRMVALHVGAWTAYAMIALRHPFLYASFTPLDAACALVIIGCVQTIALRLSRILRTLEPRAPRGK